MGSCSNKHHTLSISNSRDLHPFSCQADSSSWCVTTWHHVRMRQNLSVTSLFVVQIQLWMAGMPVTTSSSRGGGLLSVCHKLWQWYSTCTVQYQGFPHANLPDQLIDLVDIQWQSTRCSFVSKYMHVMPQLLYVHGPPPTCYHSHSCHHSQLVRKARWISSCIKSSFHAMDQLPTSYSYTKHQPSYR